jgi:4-amino-4-deoxy-L-arabinose transferase-like glycosyltransferase
MTGGHRGIEPIVVLVLIATPILFLGLDANKPPLAYSLTALTFTLVGYTEHARLWPALAGLGLLGVVFCLGPVIAGTRTGLLAGLVLLTSR